MATQLPVPIEFRLPEGWRSAPPDEVGAPGVAFVALHPASSDGFTANITISGRVRADDEDLETTGDESVRRIEQQATGEVTVRDRARIGSAESPGLTQMLDFETAVDDRALALNQCQVYLSMQDISDPGTRALVEVVLTCTRAQLDTVIGDFRQFLTTLTVSREEP
ncbi:hypothetical protein [Saccharomonospora saliphila]|uniref:hypothetical protein n=1 Tax=Saccharomonospora saliphila TaxID=369829 RepID=UPI00035DDBFF|nr:hypothetical protein [Saccharomonospora saliphila]